MKTSNRIIYWNVDVILVRQRRTTYGGIETYLEICRGKRDYYEGFKEDGGGGAHRNRRQ